MMYKDIGDPNPKAKTRALRRLWRVKIVTSKPNAKKVKTREETLIAWNSVDANRKAGGRLAEEPVAIGWVTWPRGDGQEHVYFIENPTDGPLEDAPVVPTMGGVGDEEEWDF